MSRSGSPEIDPAAFDAFEAAGWERKAGTYESFFGQLTGRLAEPLLDAAGVEASKRVLDVATGHGVVAGAAAARGAEVVGLDVAAAMVELGRRLHPGAEFRQGDAHALPFADGAFDAVVCNFGILHMGRPEKAASEFARVLVPGGRVGLTVWDRPERMRLLGVFLDGVAGAGATPPADVPIGPDFFRFSQDEAFDALLAEAGFDDREITSIGFSQRVPTPDHLWEGLLAGTVRTSALIERQSGETRDRIRQEFTKAVNHYRRDDGYELPVSVKLASGRRAA